MRTGRDVLEWMKPVEVWCRIWDAAAMNDGGRARSFKRQLNRYRRWEKSRGLTPTERVWLRLYGDIVGLEIQGHLSLIAYLNLVAHHTRRVIAPPLYVEVPPEALEAQAA